MAIYYLRAVAESGHRRRLAAVCYQLVEAGGPAWGLNVLLAEEWGEREILRKMKNLGLFEADDEFVPLGPNIMEDLRLLAARAKHHGIMNLMDDALQRFVEGKSSLAAWMSAAKLTASKRVNSLTAGEGADRKLAERLILEAQGFLKENMGATAKGV